MNYRNILKMHDYTFLTGAPGSRWSGVAQIISENFNYNNSDETDWRVYKHGEFSGHRGAYWGPEMELGQNFHSLERNYSDDIIGFKKACDRAFLTPVQAKPKMIKCHQFAYGLDWLYRNIENSQILLVKRENQECFDWWKEAGGWNIYYPKYTWYINDNHMMHYIEAENKLSNDFVKRNGDWEDFNEDWLTEEYGEHNIEISKDNYKDVKVCLIKT